MLMTPFGVNGGLTVYCTWISDLTEHLCECSDGGLRHLEIHVTAHAHIYVIFGYTF